MATTEISFGRTLGLIALSGFGGLFMDSQDHFKRLSRYYKKTDFLFNTLLWGSKHFGYYPINKRISEKEAQLLMQDLLAEKLGLSGEMKVLDAGCGYGVVSVYLAKKYDCVIEGITILPYEVRKARRLATRCGVPDRANYSVMDYSNMTFQNESFDAVYTTEALSHSTDVRQTLNEFFRVLKQSGKLALFEYTLAEDSKFSGPGMDLLNKVICASAMDGLKQFRHGRFEKIIREVGFKNSSTENITDNVKPSLDRLRRIFRIPYLIVRLLHLPGIFPNLIAANEFRKMAEEDLIRYNIFTATK